MLESFAISYLPDEDRLRVDIRAQGGQSTAFLLTRRVCAAWLQDLEAMVVRSADVPEGLDPLARSSLASAHHAALARQAKYGRATESATPLPAAALVRRVDCVHNAKTGQFGLRFRSDSGGELALSLSTPTFHGIIELLRKQLAITGWGLQLMASPPGVGGAQKSRASLH